LSFTIDYSTVLFIMTDSASPPVSPSKEKKHSSIERKDTADSMDMRHMAQEAAKSSEAAPASPNKRRGGRRGAPARSAPTRGRGAGSRRNVLRCSTADSMEMKAMQNGLRAAPVSAEGNGDDVDDSERPPSPMVGGPPISVGILLDCKDDSASSLEDNDE
jgi:hypothetical protein